MKAKFYKIRDGKIDALRKYLTTIDPSTIRACNEHTGINLSASFLFPTICSGCREETWYFMLVTHPDNWADVIHDPDCTCMFYKIFYGTDFLHKLYSLDPAVAQLYISPTKQQTSLANAIAIATHKP